MKPRLSSKIFSALFVLVLSVSAGAAPTEKLKVLTFNTWLLDIFGLPLATNVDLRRDAIADGLRATHADIVNLIEVWREDSANEIVAKLKDIYPYCSFNPDEIRFGSAYANGLLVLSKYPLKSSGLKYANGCTKPLDALIFSETSRWDEYVVSKGAIHNIVLHPQDGAIDLYSSHLGALTFDNDADDYDLDHQHKVLAQARELLAFIKQTAKTPVQLLMIDTNRHFRHWKANFGESNELDPTYQAFLSSGLHDSFMEANHFDPHTLSGVYTFDTTNNPNAKDGAFSKAPSDFIDYIFFRSKSFTPAFSRLAFKTPRPLRDGTQMFLSDHYSVGTAFDVRN